MSEENLVEQEVNPFIFNPFAVDIKDENGNSPEVPMCIVGSIGARYLCGILHDPSEVMTLFLPLVMMEAPNPNGTINFGLRPIFLSVGLMDFVTVRQDFLYMLQNDKQQDKKLVLEYINHVTAFRAAAVGIVSPTNEQVSKISMK